MNRQKSSKKFDLAYSPDSNNDRRSFSAKSPLLLLALRPRLSKIVDASTILIGILSFFGAFFVISPVSATSLTLSVPSSVKIDDLRPSSSSTYAKSSSGEIKVRTDAFFGYNLSVKAKNEAMDGKSNDLINGSNKLPSIVDAISEADYQKTESGNNVNTWGYIPSKFGGNDNTEVRPGPTNAAETLDKTSGANTSSDNVYSIAIAAKVDNTLPSGSYRNTFVISAVANSVSYSINYHLKDGENGPTPNPQEGTTTNNTIKIRSTEPTRDGYTFEGWCSADTDDETCSGETYRVGENEDIALTSGDNEIDLYAMWKSTGPQILTSMLTSVYTATTATVNFVAGDGIEVFIVADNSSVQKPYYAFPGTNVSFSSASNKKYILTVVPKSGYVLDKGLEVSTAGTTTTVTAKGKVGMYQSMQDLDNSQCTAEGTNVTDDRDGKSYSVAKIGGRCYMLSNLRLAAGTKITSADSNVSSNFTLPDKSVSDAWTSSSQNWYGKASMKECKGPIGNNTGSNKCADNTVGVTEYYYNWYAAKANPNNPSNPTSDSSSDTTADNKSLGSICPKGWILPTNYDADSSTDLSYRTLWNSGNNPAMLITSGYFGSGHQYNLGISGFWWPSTRSSNLSAYGMYLDSGGIVGTVNPKYYGLSVRCMR